MQILVPLGPSFLRMYLEPRQDGLAFVITGKIPLVSGGPEAVATLVLPWIVIVILAALVAVGTAVVSFRQEIASSWLISHAAPENLDVTVLVITCVAFIIGWVLTVWKRVQQFTYGIAEIVFGLFSIAAITYFLWEKPELSKFVGIGSGLYVVSRGMGNFWDAAIAELKAKRVQVAVTVSTGTTALLTVSESDLVAVANPAQSRPKSTPVV